MKVLVLNLGSGSLKLSLVESSGERLLLEGQADWATPPGRLKLRPADGPASETALPAGDPPSAAAFVLNHLTGGDQPFLRHPEEVAAVAHRVVHGGRAFTASVRVTPEVKKTLREVSELAPLHNPINLQAIEAAERTWPTVPQIAVFDTAFHATMPGAAYTYALPRQWREEWGLRRYGFHGLSVAYCAGRAIEMLRRGTGGTRLIVCHLGHGASVTAVQDGQSVDTSMGFTPLEGLVMGTRSGSVDPGLVLHVLRRHGLSAEEVERVLNRESGLLGLSGTTADMRTVLERMQTGDVPALTAYAVYVHRLRQTIGAMAATLGGVDALVFTAGVGENSAPIREAACRGLKFLGLEIDSLANARARPDADIAKPTSRVRILVIATREDLTAVREAVRVLNT
jgi:acetate kinase